MNKISDSIKDLIKEQPFFLFGVSMGLFNLTKLSKLIKQQIEVKTKKHVTERAILMNLSRMRKDLRKLKSTHICKINNITIHSNLCSVTYFKNQNTMDKLHNFYIKNQKQNEYILLNQREGEITIIFNHSLLPHLKKEIKDKPKHQENNVASIGAQVDDQYINTPGVFYYLMQQIALQNINIWEISSTFCEIVFYIHRKDLPLAFESLNVLMKK